ncbi:MAG TPA: methyltransferase domain-containing protein [Candidatus Sulfotelmatobacter sp.]|jgi:predicted TPR repeat methyltransferase/Flp pilus assembly protein TadD|nr:methyltransferase domain-containing protein [Candidatus Sulfotelmatobacter sp.]
MTQKMDLAQALGLAFAHLEQKRLPEARKLARSIEKVRSDAPGLAYLHGLLALADGQGRKAALHLSKALAATPDAPPLLLAMARAQSLQGRRDEAEALYRRLPGMLEAEAELAALLLQRRDWAGAAELLRNRPLSAGALNNLGVAEQALGHIEAAAIAFAQAIDSDPGYARPQANLAGVLRRLKRPADAHDAALRATRLAPQDASGWIELGQALRGLNRLDDALDALSQARNSLEADWLRGEILERLDRKAEAAAAYRRVLKRDGSDVFGAALALARLEGGQAPDRAPSAFVAALYDRYAEVFDQDLRQGLQYRAPELLLEAVRATLGDGPFDCLDLGCGTGLVGEVMQPVLHAVDGVDLSPAMIDKARQRGFYRSLGVGELTAAADRPGAYDLITAADVLIYLGDLKAAFAACAGALKTGGGFAFTVEKRDDGQDYAVQPSKRFAHSAAYLERLAGEHGFRVLRIEDNWTRTENSREVPGLVCVLMKD